ncbi:hypothetical protein F4778DRAFT_799312 [Xylariomycetidae sp. FL2044]|nr:hypothetical protein F4778DRAFT_799312 [Xylariomycetidae sp. FL2044]
MGPNRSVKMTVTHPLHDNNPNQDSNSNTTMTGKHETPEHPAASPNDASTSREPPHNNNHGSGTKDITQAIAEYEESRPSIASLSDTASTRDSGTPTTRTTGQAAILDLPNEILRAIFKHLVELGEDDLGALCYLYIAVVRLTCRRFYATSSHLLLRRIKVQMTPESLTRLERISNHSIFNKGVLSVTVSVLYHEHALAHNFRAFIAQRIVELGRETNGRRIAVDNDEKKRQMHLAAQRMLAWRGVKRKVPEDGSMPTLQYFQGSRNDIQEEAHVLRSAYHDYQQRYEAQQELLLSGNFSKAVAVAMARMPLMTTLQITDKKNHHYRLGDLDDPMIMSLKGSLPHRWCELEGRPGWKGPPVDLLTKLPVAIQRAGTTLDTLEIHVELSGITSSKFHELSPDDSLRRAVQGLQKFRFHIDSYFRVSSAENIQLLLRWLSTPSSSASLRAIDIDLNGFRVEAELQGTKLHPLVGMHNWPNLEKLSLFDVPVSMSDLKRFVNMLPNEPPSQDGKEHLRVGLVIPVDPWYDAEEDDWQYTAWD